MNNLEYFEKGLISVIEDYNEKYSSFMDGFFSSLTEDDIIKLGGWKNIFSAAGKVFKKKPAVNIISPQRVIKGVEEGGHTLINPKALRKGQYMSAKEPPRRVFKQKVEPTAPTAPPAAPTAAPEAAPAATKSNFGKGLKWGIGGLGAGVAATSAYNAYKNKNRDQQQEPDYGYYGY